MEFLKKQNKILLTTHSKEKLHQYKLPEKRVLRVLKKPERNEEEIVPRTIAVIQTTGTKSIQKKSG
jgi:hypothetical protein